MLISYFPVRLNNIENIIQMKESHSSQKLLYLLDKIAYELLYMPEGANLHDITIQSMSSDSRKISAGSLFVAVDGLGTDGHQYVQHAAEKGCAALICAAGRITKEQAQLLDVVVIEVTNTLEAYATLAARFFGNPADKICCIGITGTNGKTTVTYLLEQVLLDMGRSVGVIGTVNNRYTMKDGVKKVMATEFTTPEPLLLQALLAEMVQAGVEYVVMEVSSHALAQARVGTIKFAIAAFTNLTRDHLDYHGDMDCYFQSKKLLFTEYLDSDGVAILPANDIAGDTETETNSLHGLCQQYCKSIKYWGEGEKADIRLLEYTSSLTHTTVQLEFHGVRYPISSPLIGRFNVDNLLTVFAIGVGLGLSEDGMVKGLKKASGARGRTERVQTGSSWQSDGPVVLVDYAHTPDALSKVLETVKKLPHKDLYAVFGCGGDRDKGKRPVMGKTAAAISDVSIVTDDNPRTENPSQIIAQIVSGVAQSGVEVKKRDWLSYREASEVGCVVIPERHTAIETAIRAANSSDIVVIAGKGHEPYQLTSKGKLYFDDYQEARAVLCSWTANLVAEAVSGEITPLNSGAELLGEVHTDSREKKEKSIFVALRGDSHDAHDYALQALENGASCLVVERYLELPPDLQAHQILVEDTTQALGDLAAFRRTRMSELCSQVVIGITGSCGKTTVKEMVAAILARKWPVGEKYPEGCVLKTKGNFNNLIGLPLSLLPIGVNQKAAVLEMGMNQPGELQRLGEIANPDISCITNVYGAHLEGLQSIEGVAKAKEELFKATGDAGKLIINLDDEHICKMAADYKQSKIAFAVDRTGHEISVDLWASDIRLNCNGATTFTLHHVDKGQAAVTLHIAGEHNVSNALCAAAISLTAGAEMNQVTEGLSDFRPPDKRMQLLKGLAGVTVINDTYNANPGSMSAGLRTLKQMTTAKNAAIIGDMLELGDTSSSAHYAIGELLQELSIDYVAVVGAFREDVKQGALESGFYVDNVKTFNNKEAAVAWMKSLVNEKKLGQGDMLLVKASRGLRFETIIDQLRMS